MPNSNKEQHKTTTVMRGRAKRAPRKLNFQNESWYVAASRKVSAARTPTELAVGEISSPPLASE